MPATWYDCKRLPARPWWDQNGGRWYVSQTIPRDGSPTPMYRYKPSIHLLCESLLGSSVRDKSEKIIGIRYPSLSRRLEIYREAIEIVVVFRDYSDLLSLAVYRRYVTQHGGVPLDQLFFNLAVEANLSRPDWEELRDRMPDRAPIRDACDRRAMLDIQESAAA